MSTIDVIAAFESGDFRFDNTISMDAALRCRVCMDQWHKTSKLLQITSIANFLRTRDKHFLDWSTGNQKEYYLETATNYRH